MVPDEVGRLFYYGVYPIILPSELEIAKFIIVLIGKFLTNIDGK